VTEGVVTENRDGTDGRRRHGKSRRKVVTEGVVTENNRSRVPEAAVPEALEVPVVP
jgi:hypothetical protein